jgi:predicted transglutaminase-like cysteine proteinase
MRYLNLARSWRAAIVVAGLIGAAATAAVASPVTPSDIDDPPAVSEPFGRSAFQVPDDHALAVKWQGVARELTDELLALTLCEESRSRCGSPQALTFRDIIEAAKAKDGRARAGEINRSINLGVRAGSDLALYGEADVWRTPLALLAVGTGDCEDYAIAKFVALRAAGFAATDLRIVILRDTLRREDHAVASVRIGGRWWLLDNRRMAMVEDVQLKNQQPLFVLDLDGVRHYRDAPIMALAEVRMPEPATVPPQQVK